MTEVSSVAFKSSWFKAGITHSWLIKTLKDGYSILVAHSCVRLSRSIILIKLTMEWMIVTKKVST